MLLAVNYGFSEQVASQVGTCCIPSKLAAKRAWTCQASQGRHIPTLIRNTLCSVTSCTLRRAHWFRATPTHLANDAGGLELLVPARANPDLAHLCIALQALWKVRQGQTIAGGASSTAAMADNHDDATPKAAKASSRRACNIMCSSNVYRRQLQWHWRAASRAAFAAT